LILGDQNVRSIGDEVKKLNDVATRMMRPPNERARLYFILAWFHAVIQVPKITIRPNK
jgi:hypothetical protein